MKRVVFLTGEYPPMQGGIADHTAYLAQHLASLGVESSILISRRWQNAQTSKVSPPSFALLPDWGWRCWPGVLNFLKTHQPDVLHIQYQAAAFDLGGWVNWLPWFLKKRGVVTRIVTTFHDLRVPYIFPKAGSFRRRSILALARYSDAVICTNREDLAQLSMANSQAQISSTPLLRLIPLGSNVDPQPPAEFNRAAWRRKYKAGDNTLLMAYFGFLNESKGGEEIIEALALLRQQGLDVRLLLIGGDIGHADPSNVAYAEQVQTLIDRLQLAEFVHRTGFIGLPEVSANLLAADMVVMPYRDGVSFRRTTLIAALRHGRPVISTHAADPHTVPEVKPGENMLVVPSRDPATLAQTVAMLAKNSALRVKLSQGAARLGQMFEWDKIARDTAELYQTILDT